MTSISPAEQQFIQQHLTDDVATLVLRGEAIPNIDLRRVAEQITARQKARGKLPAWYAQHDLIFPPALSVEQASSELTAHYKASLVSGELLVDLTGGMGVDAWAFAQRMGRVSYIEHRPDLADLAAYNLPRLGATNVDVHTGDGLTYVDGLTGAAADWLYLDPHRRSEQGGRVVQLADCEPDVSRPGVLANLLAKANQLLLKTSPMIDIGATIGQLPGVEAVHVVAAAGEVKEIVFVVGKQSVSLETIQVNAVNLSENQTDTFSYNRGEEWQAEIILSDPQTYLYEPNAAILKAGAFRLAGVRFGLQKLAPNSHLYTSAELISGFPGRVFQIEHVLKVDKKGLQYVLPTLKANLTVRNFPQSVADLRRKLNLREGGDVYIFATTLANGSKRLLLCRKIV
ncbi:THUMP-like domain-containing protein [Spirosoma montaniterrae]|uniref:Uncharacterized protein n=1 Tax=Spirosoma montaniterrae TaxID=1178516 RepID=A0A1P9WUK1_9BACT|nr:SAM-dependent methyltransferase [Spirosoma montaniterrae]AQG79066.1 hypothetical protein AWR27_06845 [Spirosoma montaniterrae]